MKRLLGAMVVLLVLAASLWFPGQGERDCLGNLAIFDHHLNCRGHVALGKEEGTVTDGVWQEEYLLELSSAETLHCPTSGAKYVLTFTVGEHPSCPTHGRLIEKYGWRPHQFPARLPVRSLIVALSVGLSVVLAITMAVRLVRRVGRTKGEARPDGASAGG